MSVSVHSSVSPSGEGWLVLISAPWAMQRKKSSRVMETSSKYSLPSTKKGMGTTPMPCLRPCSGEMPLLLSVMTRTLV